MSPRRRSRGKPPIPNLYERRGYFSWRDPRTREETGLGTDRASAYAQAVEANLWLASLSRKPRLIDKLTGSLERSVAAWAKRYAELQARVELSDNTRRHYKSLLGRMVRMLGADTPMETVTPLIVSDGLEAIAVTEGKARLAQALRHFMRDSFREACVQGWVKTNPVLDTKLPISVGVKRARLELDVLFQVYERSWPWLQNAIALALTSAQRRADVSAAEFSHFTKDAWRCEQKSQKAEFIHRIEIPLTLKPPGFHLSLGEVQSQCRRTGVLSPFLVHQTEPYGNSPVGSQIFVDTISKGFTRVLKGLEIDWGERTPPTFHEIRSLSERLYRSIGIDTKTLLGHTEQETTDGYNDTRGNWVRVTV